MILGSEPSEDFQVLHPGLVSFFNRFLQYFSVKLSENMKASSFKKMQKVKTHFQTVIDSFPA